MLKHTAPMHMLAGGAAFLGYDLITEFLRHHDETNLRPQILDHLFATSVISTIGGYCAFNTMKGAFTSFLFLGLTGGFMSYYVMQRGLRPGS